MPFVFPTVRSIKFCLVPAILAFAASSAGCRLFSRAHPPQIAPDAAVVLVELQLKQRNPLAATDAVSQKIDNLLHASLVQRGLNGLEPELAEHWSHEGHLKFFFRLKKGLLFHDGTPLVASDVVNAIQKFQTLSVHAPAFTHIKRVWSEGTRDVRIETDIPQPFLLEDLPLVKIFKDPTIGAGRFRLVRQSGDQIELERFDGFYERMPEGGLRRLFFKYVSDDTTRYQMLARGDGNALISSLSLSKLLYLKEKPVDGLKSFDSPGINVTYLAFNHRDPRLAKFEVRQAIAHAIDLDSILRHRFGGRLASPATGLLSPAHVQYYEPSVMRYGYDPATSERLLDQSGLPRKQDGWRFSLVFKTTTEKYGNDMARILAGYLRQVGIDVRLRILEPATFYRDIKLGDFQLFHSRWVGIANPSIYYRVFHSSQIASLNRGAYQNPEMDRLLDQGMTEPNDAKRVRVFSEVQKLAARDLPYVNLWRWNNTFVGTDDMQGIRMYPNGDFLTFAHLTRRKK